MNPEVKKILWCIFYLATGIWLVLDPTPFLFLPARACFALGLFNIFCAGGEFAEAARYR